MFRTSGERHTPLNLPKIQKDLARYQAEQDQRRQTVISIDPEQGLPIWRMSGMTLAERSVSENSATSSLRQSLPVATELPRPRLDQPKLAMGSSGSIGVKCLSTDELLERSLHRLGLPVDHSIQDAYNEHRNSIAMHLSVVSTLSESGHHARLPVNPAANYCWPLRWLGSIVSRWAHSLTPAQRKTWIGRIRTFEQTLHSAIRKQIVFNGYKYTVKVLFFLLQMQMPEAVMLGFQMADINNRFDSLQVWRL